MQCHLPVFLGNPARSYRYVWRGEFLSYAAFGPRDPTASKFSTFSVMPPNYSSLTFSFVPLPHRQLPVAPPLCWHGGRQKGAKMPGEGPRGSPAGERGGGANQKDKLATAWAAFRGQAAAVSWGSRGRKPLRLATGSRIHPQMNQTSELALCKSCSCCSPRWTCPGWNVGDRECHGWARG